MRKPYVSFTYKLPLTSSRTVGGAGGFAGGGAGAGDFATTTGGGFFVALGAGVFAGGVVDAVLAAGALVELAVTAEFAGVVGHLVAGVAVGGGVGGVELFAATEFAGGAEVGGGTEAAGDAGAATDPGILLAVATGGADAGATVGSAFTGFGGATDFSVAGSGFFSLLEFAAASDMVIVAT
jgi:hypothetical protein